MQIELPRQLPGPCLEGPTLGGGFCTHPPPPPPATSGCPEGTSRARVLAAGLSKHGWGLQLGQSGPLTLGILSPEHGPTNRARGGPPPTPSATAASAPHSSLGLTAREEETRLSLQLLRVRQTARCHGERGRQATQTARRGRGAPPGTSAVPPPAARPLPELRARRGKARPPARGAPTRTERLTLRLCVGFTTQTSCPAAEKTRLAL